MAWLTRWLLIFLSIFCAQCADSAENQTASYCPESIAKQRPKFPKKKIAISKTTIEVEVAETQDQLGHGLMCIEKLGENQGMLFVFPNEEIRSFWMKNTYIDLSIGFFDKNKTLFQITDMKAASVMQRDFPSYMSSSAAQFALEVPKGWFSKQGIKIGDKFNWR